MVIAPAFLSMLNGLRGVHLAAADQGLPIKYGPVWQPGELVFQGGMRRTRVTPVEGGGVVHTRSFAGREPAYLTAFASPNTSATGGGRVPDRPNFLTRLLGPPSAQF